MHKYIAEFGLSPASRSRVSTMPTLGPRPWEFGRSKFDGLLGVAHHDDDPAERFFKDG